MGEIPNTGSSLPLPGLSPGLQAKKAIQLQRLRALKTEPVAAPKPAAKRQKKNVVTKTYSKPLAKSDKSDNLPATVRGKMAEKAKIYGAPKRPRKARNGQKDSQLSVTGSTKKFQTHNAVRVFR